MLMVLYGWFLSQIVPSVAGQPYNALILVSETLTALLVLIRRPGPMATSFYAWAIAIIGTCAPLLVQPAGGALIPIGAAAALMIVGLFVSLAAKLFLRRSFGIVAACRGVRREGPYRLVRHPMYTGYVITQLGFLLANPSLLNLAVYGAAWAMLLLRIEEEETMLSLDPGLSRLCRGGALPAAAGPLLVLALRRHHRERQGRDRNPLLAQIVGLLRRRLAVDRAALGLAEMDGAGLVGEAVADMLALLEHLLLRLGHAGQRRLHRFGRRARRPGCPWRRRAAPSAPCRPRPCRRSGRRRGPAPAAPHNPRSSRTRLRRHGLAAAHLRSKMIMWRDMLRRRDRPAVPDRRQARAHLLDRAEVELGKAAGPAPRRPCRAAPCPRDRRPANGRR